MNMEEKRLRKSPSGLARKRLGTKAHFSIKASPPLSYTRAIIITDREHGSSSFALVEPVTASGGDGLLYFQGCALLVFNLP
jgi:hypothetical protein